MGEWDENGFAPHGTVIHWVTQVGIGCVFLPREPEGDEELKNAAEHFGGDQAAARQACLRGDPLYYKPTAAEYASARTLFRGDPTAHNNAVAAASQVLASRIEPARDRRPWIAESSWNLPYATGHIDLLSHDHVELKDIKTTAKPPDVAEVVCKPEYFAQVVLYGRFVGARYGTIEFVDSMRGMWAYRVRIDFTKPAVQRYAAQLEEFCYFLMSDDLWKYAWPNLGGHCEKTWCPYRISCKRPTMPGPGEWFDAVRAYRPSGLVSIPRVKAPSPN